MYGFSIIKSGISFVSLFYGDSFLVENFITEMVGKALCVAHTFIFSLKYLEPHSKYFKYGRYFYYNSQFSREKSHFTQTVIFPRLLIEQAGSSETDMFPGDSGSTARAISVIAISHVTHATDKLGMHHQRRWH